MPGSHAWRINGTGFAAATARGLPHRPDLIVGEAVEAHGGLQRRDGPEVAVNPDPGDVFGAVLLPPLGAAQR